MCQLVAHAELSKPKPVSAGVMESRRSPRRSWPVSMTLYPQIVDPEEPTDPTFEEPTVVASISDLSRAGMGLIHQEPMQPGTEFEIDWEQGGNVTPIRLQVVHSRQIAPQIFRSGAKVISDNPIPIEFDEADAAPRAVPVSHTPVVRVVQTPAGSDRADAGATDSATERSAAIPLTPRPFMRIDGPLTTGALSDPATFAPAPAGTLRMPAAGPRFATTQRVKGTTVCGFERQVEVCRVGDKLWIYIHSPGKKNGWGIYVDPSEFESAMAAIAGQVSHPTISMLAA